MPSFSMPMNGVALTSIALLILLALLLPINTQAATLLPEVAPSPLRNTTQPLNVTVCISDFPPFTFCNQSYSSNRYTGFDTDFFRAVVSQDSLKLREGIDYNFLCVDSESITPHVSGSVNVTCDVVAGGMTITSDRVAAGARFSYPTYKSGLTVVVAGTVGETEGWAFIDPFTWQLWLAIFITLLVLPLLVFLVEVASLKRRFKLGDIPAGYAEATYYGGWTMIGQVDYVEVSSWAARICVLCFGFMCLILCATYTANLAAILVSPTIRSSINSIEDLQGLKVATVDLYSGLLKNRYGIIADEVEINDTYDIAPYLQAVSKGEYSAFIYDSSPTKYALQQYGICDLVTLPIDYQPFDIGFSFAEDVPADIIRNFSEEVIRLQEAGYISTLHQTYMARLDAYQCYSAGQDTAVTFQSVYGLWAILLGGIGLSFFVVCCKRFVMRRQGDWDLLHKTRRDIKNSSTAKDGEEKGASASDTVAVDIPVVEEEEGSGTTKEATPYLHKHDSHTFVEGLMFTKKREKAEKHRHKGGAR